MTCASCSAAVQRVVSKLDGVERADVNLTTEKLTVVLNKDLDFKTIQAAVEKAGYVFGDDIMIALDCAASEFYVNGNYDYTKFEGETGKIRTSEEQACYLAELCEKYPIISIEDGMYEDDWAGWKLLTEKIGNKV